MGDSLTYLNAFMYILAFVYFYMKKRKLDLGVTILFLYAFSNSISVFYFSFSFVSSLYTRLTLAPYIYLFSMILLCVYPLLKFNSDGIQQVTAKNSLKFIRIVSVFIILVTVEPLFENLYLIFKPSGNTLDDLNSIYSARNGGEQLSIYSEVGRRLNYISNLLCTTSLLFLFYSLTLPKRNKWILIGSLAVALNTLLNYFNSSNRAGILSYFLFALACYFLFRSSLSANINRKIKLYGVIALTSIVALSLLITIARFDTNNTENNIFSWLALYGGEGSIKFNNDLWYIKTHTDGDQLFAFLKNLFGFETFQDADSRDSYYFMKNGIKIEVFYTFLGDIYYDFGLIGTPIFCLLIFAILKFLTRSRRRYPLDVIFLLALFSHVFLIGFTAYIHRAYSAQFGLLFPLSITLILYYNRKRDSRLSNNVN